MAEITVQEAYTEVLKQLRDRPYAHAYKDPEDHTWSVIVFSGQGDEMYSVTDLNDAEFDVLRPLCVAINENDGDTIDNPAYVPGLLEG